MTNYIEIYTILSLIICSFLILTYDFYKSPKNVLLNLSSYSLLYSIFYYGVPFLNIEYLFEYFDYSISNSTLIITRFYSIWTLFIFLALYLLIRNNNSTLIDLKKRNYSPPNIFIITIIIFLLTLSIYILSKVGSDLIANFSNRVSAYTIYVQYKVKYKLPILFIFLLYCIYTLKVNRNQKINFIYYIVPLIFMTPELLSGGRGMLFTYILFLFVLSILKLKDNTIKKAFLFIASLLFIMVFIRYLLTRNINENTFEYTIYSFFAEFYHTAFTTPYILEHNIFSYTDSIKYIIYPFSKFFTPITNYLDINTQLPWYADIVSEHINRHFGFAGNIISEALYYWGPIAPIIYPLIISLIIIIHNNYKNSITGFFFFIIMAINLRLFFRGSFWDSYTSILIWFFIFYFLFFIVSIFFKKKKRV
ncbi:O-antigen polymerase [Proteus mirabilis]|uniref:O-antigen polymerase n=1 Tax=Proteus mirabilis TaxID=584 RepID=UPI0018C85C83|nr:oligosaccharide repeat unit polymerase [Proteus mirabilis]HEK3248981.1 oligosaccharide repeat unit polymerase [Proteus mirabilis]